MFGPMFLRSVASLPLELLLRLTLTKILLWTFRCVIRWDVSSGDLGPALQRFPLLRPEHQLAGAPVSPPALRALDCMPGSEVFMAGARLFGSTWIWIWGLDLDLDFDLRLPVGAHSADDSHLKHRNIFRDGTEFLDVGPLPECKAIGVWSAARPT